MGHRSYNIDISNALSPQEGASLDRYLSESAKEFQGGEELEAYLLASLALALAKRHRAS